MERSALSKITDLRDQIMQLHLAASIQRDMLDFLSELESRLYVVEQDNTILKGQVKAMREQIASLNSRYSELLYALSDRRRG